MTTIPYILVLLAYGIVSFVHLLPGVAPRAVEERARLLVMVGATVHLFELGGLLMFGAVAPGYPEALSAASFGIAVAWLVVARDRLSSIGVFLTPLSSVMLGFALIAPRHQVAAMAADPVAPSLAAPIHLGLMVAGLAGFAVSFAVGVVYLVVRDRLKRRKLSGLPRLPALETLDRIQFRAMLFGFVFLTLGIVTGGAWAAWSLDGGSWVADPKVWFTAVIWLWYGVALQVRLVAGWRGRWGALFSIVGFTGMVFSLVALDSLVSGFHAYGP